MFSKLSTVETSGYDHVSQQKSDLRVARKRFRSWNGAIGPQRAVSKLLQDLRRAISKSFIVLDGENRLHVSKADDIGGMIRGYLVGFIQTARQVEPDGCARAQTGWRYEHDRQIDARIHRPDLRLGRRPCPSPWP